MTFDVTRQIAALYSLVEAVAVVTCCVVVGALVATQVVVFTSGPVLVDVVAVELVAAFWRESAQRRVVKVAWKLAALSNTTFDYLVAFALLGLGREELGIRAHEFSQFTVNTLVVTTTTRC